MRIPSGALYLDLLREDTLDVLTAPNGLLLTNLFPYDGQTGVPASAMDAQLSDPCSFPINLCAMNVSGGTSTIVGVKVWITVGYTVESTPSSVKASVKSVVTNTSEHTINVTVQDQIAIADKTFIGNQDYAYKGGIGPFPSDWIGTITNTNSPPGLYNDERWVKLWREEPFASLQTVEVKVTITGNGGLTATETYSFTIEDLTKPEVVSVYTRGLTKLRVLFSEAVEQDTDATGDALLVVDIAGGAFVEKQVSGNAHIISTQDVFESGHVGQYIGIAGAENALNNDIFEIASYINKNEITINATNVVSEALPSDCVVTISPYRVDGIPDAELLIPYFNPVVISAEAISSTEIELALHAEITPNRAYNFKVTTVQDLNDNTIDDASIAFTTEALNIPADRANAEFSIPNLIPEANKRVTEDSTGDLRRLLNCFDESIQLLLHDIDRFPEMIDIDTLSGDNLDAMLAHLGSPFSFGDALTSINKQRLAAILVDLYKRKGVEAGMEAALSYILGITADVRAYYDPTEYWIIGVGLLGESTLLGPGDTFLRNSFEVETTSNLTETERRQLLELVNWMKPAHTHLVRLIEPGTSVVINDSLLVTDEVAASGGTIDLALQDTCGITDHTEASEEHQRTKNDLIIPIDSLQVVRHLYRGISNSIVLGDAVSIEADSFWDRLFNAAATDTPEVLWYYDPSFITVDGSNNISAWACAWASGWDLAQATAARRPTAGATAAQFDRTNTEWLMNMSLPSNIAAADRVHVYALEDMPDDSSDQFVFNSQDISHVNQEGFLLSGGTWWAFYSSTWRNTTYNPNTGTQYYVWKMITGTTTAQLRRNGANVGNAFTYNAPAMGPEAFLMGGNNLGNNPMSGDLAFYAIYTGTADYANYEAIAAERLGL